jgi:hypothetical protein
VIFSSVKNIKIPEGNIISISKNNKVLWRKGKYKKRLAYLESDGKQYLDTEIIGKSGVKTFLDFEFISGDLTDYIPFGSASGNWATRFYPVSTRDGAWVLGYGSRITSTTAANLG